MRRFLPCLLAVCTLALCSAAPTYRGMSYTSFGQNDLSGVPSDQSLRNMAADYVDTVGINVWEFQDTPTSTVITPDFTRYSSSMASIRHAIEFAHSLHMKVMLKPIVDCRTGDWRGTIPPSAAWFKAYTAFIVKYAVLARQEHVELLSIGCEFNANQGADLSWRNVCYAVRSQFSGKLVYAANWDSWSSVTWWDRMDAIGIDAYFPLTDHANPTLPELKQAWTGIATTINTWRAAHQPRKQVVFTEVGYSSIAGTNETPWSWTINGALDLQEQADCYQALMDVLYKQNWWGGAFWWNWMTDPNAGGMTDSGFTPQGKPAETVLKSFYHRGGM